MRSSALLLVVAAVAVALSACGTGGLAVAPATPAPATPMPAWWSGDTAGDPTCAWTFGRTAFGGAADATSVRHAGVGVLATGGRSITGHVTTADGSPMSDAVVIVAPAWRDLPEGGYGPLIARTDASGAYGIGVPDMDPGQVIGFGLTVDGAAHGAPRGSAGVSGFSVAGDAVGTIPLEAIERGVTIDVRYPPLHAVSGRVEASGRSSLVPFAVDATVPIGTVTAGRPFFTATATIAPDGTYLLLLPDGEFEIGLAAREPVTAHAPWSCVYGATLATYGSDPGGQRTVSVAGVDRTGLDLVAPAGAISGTLTNADGSPVDASRGFEVVALTTDASGTREYHDNVYGDGAYWMPVEPGTYAFRVIAGQRDTYDASSGLTVAGGGRVEGIVVGPSIEVTVDLRLP